LLLLFYYYLFFRCYFDWYLLEFLKKTTAIYEVVDSARRSYRFVSPSETGAALAVTIPPHKAVFFLFRIYSVNAKIDFKCGNFMVDQLRRGDFTQMLNVFPIEGLEISLQQIDLRRAVGWIETLQKSCEIWVNNIHERQLHRVISGVAPLRGLSKVGSGLQNLIYIPASEYHKHGFDDNFLRVLRQSTSNFIHTVTTEVLHASHQLTMFVANSIKDLVSDEVSGGATSPTARRSHQPEGIQESLSLAYGALQREIGTAAETIIAVPIRQYERTGAGGYVKSVIRAMPIAVLRPAAGVSEAISYTLLGLRNQLDPNSRVDEEDEWNADHSMFLGTDNTNSSRQNRDKNKNLYASFLNNSGKK
jgi:autophagy-related protein 2